MTEIDYREAYEKEHLKCADLAAHVAEQDARIKQLEWEIGRIKNNPLWKLSKPLRMCMHWVIRQKDRLKRCKGPKEAINKLKRKIKEKKVSRKFGTGSFPSPQEAAAQRAEKFPRMVKVSILVPLWNNDPQFQREMLDCIMNQTYENWELCLADGSDAEHAYIGDICREYAAKSGGRILYQHLEKNGGIASNTNACYEMATGDYIGLYDQDDILHPSALYEYVKVINERNADFVYCDEITFHDGDINKMITLHFKPDYAPDNLRANNYICHFSVFSRKLMDGTELFRTKFDGSQDHDMILRLTDKAEHIVHVPKVLYYWRSHPGSVASDIDAKPYAVEAAKQAVSEHLQRHGFEHFHITSSRAFATIFRIQYEVLGNPKISIIIPNKDHVEDLKRCIDSILKKSTYENYEIIVVENNSTTPEIKEYYEELCPGWDKSPVKGQSVSGHGMSTEASISDGAKSSAKGEPVSGNGSSAGGKLERHPVSGNSSSTEGKLEGEPVSGNSSSTGGKLEREPVSGNSSSTGGKLERHPVSGNSSSTEGKLEREPVSGKSSSTEGKLEGEPVSGNGRIRVVPYQGRFNYSAVNNFGEKYATGDYILLLNNDTEVITVNWLEEMLMYAQRKDVGAVGAMLYYPDQTIQHAGVVIGLGAHRTAGHVHYKEFWQNLGYMGRLCYAQNYSAVTGACLMVKRSLYEELSGLDESYEISLNDVDFCLRLREKGLLNVWTPFAELYHYESASRGLDDEGEKAERYNRESEQFRSRWKKLLDQGDPYFNPNFSLDRSDFSLRIDA